MAQLRQHLGGGQPQDVGLAGERQAGAVHGEELERVAVGGMLLEDLAGDPRRRAHQRRAVVGGVVQGAEGRVVARYVAGGDGRFVVRRELPAGGAVIGGGIERPARGDQRRRGVVSVVRPAGAVVVDQLGVIGHRLDDVGGEDRVAPQGGQLHRAFAGGAAVPDGGRLLMRTGERGRAVERGPEAARPGDLLLAPQPAQQLVVLLLQRVLVVRIPAEEPPGLGGVALADGQLQPAAGELVDGGVVLGDPYRIEGGQHGDGGEEPDAVRTGGDRAQHRGRRAGQERRTVPLADAEGVEPQLLGQHGEFDDLLEAVVRGEEASGQRVRDVVDQSHDTEAHTAPFFEHAEGTTGQGQRR